LTASLVRWWATTPTEELLWLVTGVVAELMFAMRFILQWIATERARSSTVPEAFWYFSCVGGLMLLIYAIHRLDPVFMFGQAAALLIYGRNIYFIWRRKKSPTPLSVASSNRSALER